MKKERLEYPFKEGDEYWTIEESLGSVSGISSYWDDVSEEIHNNNPSKLYFKTQDEVIYYILKTNQYKIK
jgi:hypothetical protein